jgi:hypothetical protein
MLWNASVRTFLIFTLAICLTAPAAGQALLGPGGFSENFDSMGAAGTTPPMGWQVYQIAGGSSTWINDTGSNSIPDVGAIPNGATVAGGTASVGLVANNSPTGNQVNGYNATGASGAAADRGIATAPTGIAGSAIELQITNNTGAALASVLISYEIRRYQVGADNATRTPGAGIPEGSDELPGYWLFYSLDNGATYTAVDTLIPVGAGPALNPIVPNTLGITSVASAPIVLGGLVNAGSNLFLRWVDDNAIDPSPDEIIGIDNVSLTIPEPASVVLLVATLVSGGRFVRRRVRSAN